MFICSGTNDVCTLGFDSCEEAAWLWECAVLCDLLECFCLFRDKGVCKASFLPIDVINLSDEHVEGHGEHLFQSMESAGIVPIVSCGGWFINDKVVWFVIVNAFLQSPMLRNNEGTFGVEVVNNNIFEVEAHCL